MVSAGSVMPVVLEAVNVMVCAFTHVLDAGALPGAKIAVLAGVPAVIPDAPLFPC
jgi:hypothetical protein